MATTPFPVTWNPQNKSQALLSNGDLTATYSSSPTLHAVLVSPNGGIHTGVGGRYYCEITLDLLANDTGEWGLRSTADVMGGGPSRVGEATDSCAIAQTTVPVCRIRFEGSELSTGLANPVQGDIISIAFDAFIGSVWFAINGVWVEGDPNAGTGASVTGFLPSNAVGPACSADSNGNTDKVTINCGATAFTYTPPTSYVGFDFRHPLPSYSWNNSDRKYSDITNGGRTITGNNALGNGAARTGLPLPRTGRHYWEIVIDAVSADANLKLGGASPYHDITGTVIWGEDTQDGWSYRGNGTVRVNDVGSSGFATATTGDVVGFAYDADAGEAWVSINETWIQGDPATGASPPITGVGTWQTFIGGAIRQDDAITANFDPSTFSGIPPQGFAPLNHVRNPDRIWLVDVQVHDGASGELLSDPDFDGDLPGWTLSGTAALSVGTLKITSQAEANRAEQTVTVTNGDTYELRLWVRHCATDVPTTPCTIGIEFGDASTDGSKTEIMGEAHSWFTHSGVFGATHTIKIYISETGAGTGYYLSVDHASLRLVEDFESLYFSTHGYTTSSTDVPAGTSYQPRLVGDLTFSQTVDIVDTSNSQVGRDVGVILIANTDGGLDEYLSRSWAGRPITIRTVGKGEPLTSATTVVVGLVGSVSSNDDSITLVVSDRSADMDRLFPLTRYLGTATDDEGGAEVLGRPKPIALGAVGMVAPVLINQTTKKYQATAWPNQGVVLVYDGGVALTRITSGSPTGGEFLDEYGALTLGSNPTYLLVVDGASLARVDYDAGPAALASMTKISEIVRNLATRWGEFADPSEMDISRIESLTTASDHAVQAYIAGQVSLADIISRLVRAIPGIWGFSRDGRFFFQRIASPATPRFTYTEADIQSVRRTQSLEPAWRVSVEHSRTHTVHAPNDIAAGASAAVRQQISRQYETAAASNSAIRRANPLARDLEFSFPIDQTGGENAAADLLALHGTRRDYIVAELREDPGVLNIGDVIALNRTRRPKTWNKDYLVIGIDERSTSPLVTLRLWG